MQVKDIDIDTGKIKGYKICKKKVRNLIFRWFYHSDLLYIMPATDKRIANYKLIRKMASRVKANTKSAKEKSPLGKNCFPA